MPDRIAAIPAKRLAPREQLPDITEEPKSAWLAGLFTGTALGVVIGAGLMVMFLCRSACR